MAFERISLNIIPDGEMPVFHASQFDAGRPIIIDLYNGDDAYTPAAGVTFELHCRKVDDNIVTLDTYEVDGNTVTFASTEQLCACSGDNLCEVAIMLDDLLMGTLNFILHVERDPLAGGLTSETSIYNLTEQIDDIISGEGYVKDTDLEVLQSDWNETDENSPAYIKNKPGPALADQADWTETDPLKLSYIKHKPDLKTVATTGSYNDLTDKPTIPTKTSELTNDSGFVESSDLAAVATSGDYDDLLNKPTIPAAQVQSDWNQTNISAVDFIKNKPDLMLVKSASGNPCTFDTDLADNLVSLTAEIVAGGGGGTPSTPIPINGYTEANITRCGVNLFGGEYNIAYKLHIPANTQFTISCNKLGVDVPRFEVLDASQTIIDYWSINSVNDDGRNFRTFTLAYDVYYIRVYYSNSDSIQLNFGADIPYHPYNGQTFTVAFGQTVYGGVLDITRGKLTVTHGYITLDGTQTLAITNWRPNTNTVGWAYPYSLTQNAFVPDGSVPDITSNCLTAVKYNSLFSDDVEGVGTYASDSYGLFVRIADTTLTTESAINTYLANNPIQVRFKLSTPFDIDLTPVQISALVGTNNITSDLGGDVEVKYVSGELAGQIIDICKMVIAEQGE